MVQSVALTRRLSGALPDEVSGVRRHRMVSNVPRRNLRGCAVDAPQGHRTPRRGRARTGAYPRRPLRCGARETARAWRTVGRADGNRPWREVSRATEERSDVVPFIGPAQEAGASNGWRDWCLDDTPRPPHATAREYASKGSNRNSLRGPDCLRAEPDRPAKLTRTPARAADAAPGAVDSFRSRRKKLPEALLASLRRTAFRAVSYLLNC